MTGVIATTVVAHVPTLGLAKNTPAYQETLVAAERAMGAALRSVLKPDLWVVVSTHWVATFDWLVTMQAMHEGVCVADEAPNLIPGVPYKFRGDVEFANALIESFGEAEIPSARNDSPHYQWDYGTFVPLQYLEVFDRKRIRLSRIRTFHVHDLDHLLRHALQPPLSAGFKQNLVSSSD